METTAIKWNGFDGVSFTFESNYAHVIKPNCKPNGKWALKTEYVDAFPNTEIELLNRGWHIAYNQNDNRWAENPDLLRKCNFIQFVSKAFNLDQKCAMIGMSCGGLHAVYFAAKYPSRIAALYLDAPVFNLLSCPMGLGKAHNGMVAEFENATGMTLIDLINYRNHPIDQKEKLLSANIPVIMVYGDSDESVPYDENGAHFEKFYRENGGIIEVYGKENCGHHPHGLEDPTPLIEFAEKYSNKTCVK